MYEVILFDNLFFNTYWFNWLCITCAAAEENDGLVLNIFSAAYFHGLNSSDPIITELWIQLQTYELLPAISEIPEIQRTNDVELATASQSSQVFEDSLIH